MIESKNLNIANTKFVPANQYIEFAALNLLSVHTIINMYNSSNNMLIFDLLESNTLDSSIPFLLQNLQFLTSCFLQTYHTSKFLFCQLIF